MVITFRRLVIASTLLLLAALLGATPLLTPAPARAHGKEIDIAVTPLIPDPDRPLVRLYRVLVMFRNDQEPVEDATVVLTAERDDGSTAFPALELTEVGDGLYVGETVFSRFGEWQMTLSVEAELSQGEGSVSFVDNVRPGSLNPDQEEALRQEADRVIRLQLSFGFGWWPDVVNILMRIVHSGAGLAYFAAVALAFSVARFGTPSRAPRLPQTLRRMFLPVAALSLAVLLGAGLYSAAFDAPITSPGIYDLDTMRQIPYGEWYLAAFFVKVALFLLLVGLAVRIHRSLRVWLPAGGSDVVSGSTVTLQRETSLSLLIGVAVIADVAVLIYLHYVSHLAVFLPDV